MFLSVEGTQWQALRYIFWVCFSSVLTSFPVCTAHGNQGLYLSKQQLLVFAPGSVFQRTQAKKFFRPISKVTQLEGTGFRITPGLYLPATEEAENKVWSTPSHTSPATLLEMSPELEKRALLGPGLVLLHYHLAAYQWLQIFRSFPAPLLAI